MTAFSSTQNRAELSLNPGDSGGEHFQHAELAHHALKVTRDAKMAQRAKALRTNTGGLSLIFGTEWWKEKVLKCPLTSLQEQWPLSSSLSLSFSLSAPPCI